MKHHLPSRLPLAALISAILAGPSVAAPVSGQWVCETGADGGWACFQMTEGGRVPVVPKPVVRQEPKPEPVAAPAPAAEPEPQPAPMPVAEPEAVPEPAPEPKPEPQPTRYETPRPAERVAEPAPQRRPEPRPVRREEPAPVARTEPAPRPPEPKPTREPERDYEMAGAAMAERYWESENRWALCGGPAAEPEIPADRLEALRREDPVRAEADEADIDLNGGSTFSGNVSLARADQRLAADRVVYDKNAESADAEGNVRFRQQGFEVERAASAWVEMAADRSKFTELAYRLPRQHARGEAAVAEMDGAADRARLERVSYTTCPEGNGDWQLTAEEVTLDQPSNEGVARNAKLTFKGMPIFGAPWFSFPLDDRRKSGVLPPRIGASDETGFDAALPYYFNLAPNYDATLTPRIMSERGLQLGGEFRYLMPTYYGQINAEVLPDDDEYGDTRALLTFEHFANPYPNLHAEAVVNYVTDDDYLDDLGGTLARSSITHLERHLLATWYGGYWNLQGRVQDYQTVDQTLTVAQRPYQRMPQVTFEGEWPWKNGLRFGLDAEYVNFDHEVNVTGDRFDVQPRISLDWGGPGYYVTPSLSYRHTGYDLDNVAAGTADDPDRGLPIFSLDGGLFFERDTSVGGRALVQTLEPRLYYLYVEEEDQTALPLFDTAVYDFSFAQLFRENRFGGTDRVGDANQLTLALSSRYLDAASGRELFRASAGQIFYFEDRDVTLPWLATETDDQSDFVAELESRLWKDWLVRGTWQWDVEDEETDKGVVQLRYNPGKRRILNLAYRYRRNLVEQTDVSLFWPVTPNWAAIARWNYDLDGERGLETLAGFEYQSCCWSWRLVGRNYVNDLNDEDNTGIYLQLELKGVGRIGTGLESVLERGILGYHSD